MKDKLYKIVFLNGHIYDWKYISYIITEVTYSWSKTLRGRTMPYDSRFATDHMELIQDMINNRLLEEIWEEHRYFKKSDFKGWKPTSLFIELIDSMAKNAILEDVKLIFWEEIENYGRNTEE